jgi:NAD(P)-dependent dehydrogenase (short-subunit alcohol dehydrogenase family)
MQLRGASALITGGGGGIGRATALRFAREGVCRLVLVDVDLAAVERTAELAAAAGARTWVRRVDVSSSAEMEALARWVADEPGVPDIIVNNAGIGVAGPFLATPLPVLERLVAVNLWGVVHGCRLFAPQMRRRGRGGHIVNVASAAAFAPSTILPAYGMTKAAVVMLSESLRIELARDRIGVSAVCPGIVATDIVHTTTYVAHEEQTAVSSRRAAIDLYRRRNYGPERVAGRIVAAIRHNRAVAPVTAEAFLLRGLSRFAPGVLRRLGAAVTL